MPALPTILVVDDDQQSLEALKRALADDFDVKTAATSGDARHILAQEWVQIVLCHQHLRGVTGVDFLQQLRAGWPEVIRILLADGDGSAHIGRAVNDADIYQYIAGPWQRDSLILTLKSAARLFELQRQNDALSIELKMIPGQVDVSQSHRRKQLRCNYQQDDGIVRTADSPMNEVCAHIRQVAPYDIPVLITGESGTGKELGARALHSNSLRWDKPFVVENCGALPDELLESELFGYKRGAFTGAVEDRVGLFEHADGGTVFLDEIGEISPAFQVKLLRVLQDGEVRPLGSNRTRHVDVRVIAATNRDLEEEVNAGRFREDLYYRLSTVSVILPPLRQRREDIPALATALLEKAMVHLGKSAGGFTPEAMACMQEYHWPGNVRELHNEISHMLVTSREHILGAELLSPRVLHAAVERGTSSLDSLGSVGGTLKERVETLEARILKESLIRHRWNKSRAASELGLSRVGLRNKLERYGLARTQGARSAGGKAAARQPENIVERAASL
jgi:two-component system response regulator HupR/HoxA